MLVVAIGVLFIKQENSEKLKVSTAKDDAQAYKDAADYAIAVQQEIKDGKTKKAIDVNVVPSVQSDPLKEGAAPSATPPASTPTPATAPAPVAPPVVVAPKINGKCGSANSQTDKNPNCDKKAPTANFCTAGDASAVAFNPNKYNVGWDWSCNGKNGGTSATCRCS